VSSGTLNPTHTLIHIDGSKRIFETAFKQNLVHTAPNPSRQSSVRQLTMMTDKG